MSMSPEGVLKKETYEKIIGLLVRKRAVPVVIDIFGKILTVLTALLYFVEIGWLVVSREYKLVAGLILVPALFFVLLSKFREKINAKRPYELYGFKPLIKKDTKGLSFPSRHVFSIFVIGGSIWVINKILGTIILIMGLLLAIIRVITGVHFPKDVIAGAFIGCVCSMAMFIFLLL